jgi:hypothetical protein
VSTNQLQFVPRSRTRSRPRASSSRSAHGRGYGAIGRWPSGRHSSGSASSCSSCSSSSTGGWSLVGYRYRIWRHWPVGTSFDSVHQDNLVRHTTEAIISLNDRESRVLHSSKLRRCSPPCAVGRYNHHPSAHRSAPLQRAARAMGHVSSVVMALLLLPVPRRAFWGTGSCRENRYSFLA